MLGPPEAQTSKSGAWALILGLGLAALLSLAMATNAGRAFLEAAAFADYLGVSLADETDRAWVYIYALRALFIALITAVFVILRDVRALLILAACALVMPLGDAVLALGAGAPAATIARHIAYVTILAITVLALAAALKARGSRNRA